MHYLEQNASLLYFNLTKHSYYLGVLSWLHVQDRMFALSEMCEPEDPTYIAASRILSLEGYDGEFESWRESDRNNEQDSNAGQRRPGGRIYPDNDGFYHFLSRLSKTKDWEFHQADADFFPSVPHGHYKGRNQPKLDAYLGWVYKNSAQIDRLSRDAIVELWNDASFRKFAKTSITWFMEQNPNFNWRVSDPMLLPRIRR
ncbi:hypothetical protein ACX122_03810 [Kosakonia cowanii]